MKSELSTHVARKYPLSEFKEAIEYYLENQSAGKVLLQPGLAQRVDLGPRTVKEDKVMKLYADGPDNFFLYNVVMTAKYFRYPIQVVIVDPEMA